MRTPLIALTALSLIAGAPAAAEDMVVHYSDLNLATPEGQKALDARIDSTARKYCGVGRVTTGTRINRGAAQCVRDARNAARESMASLIETHSKGG